MSCDKWSQLLKLRKKKKVGGKERQFRKKNHFAISQGAHNTNVVLCMYRKLIHGNKLPKSRHVVFTRGICTMGCISHSFRWKLCVNSHQSGQSSNFRIFWDNWLSWYLRQEGWDYLDNHLTFAWLRLHESSLTLSAFKYKTSNNKKGLHWNISGVVRRFLNHFQSNQPGYTLNSASLQVTQTLFTRVREGKGVTLVHRAEAELQWLSRFAKTTCFVTVLAL